MLQNVLKGKEIDRRVVEHAVQDHIHPQRVGLADKLLQILLGPEGGVNGVVIVRVVFMAGSGLEHGREVEDIRPQGFEVVQTADDPPQGALQVGVMAAGGLIPHLRRDILVRGKAGGENLIDHLVFCPAGQHKTLLLPEGLGAVVHFVNVCDGPVIKSVVAVIDHGSRPVLDLEKISKADHVDLHFSFIIIAVTVRMRRRHGIGMAASLSGRYLSCVWRTTLAASPFFTSSLMRKRPFSSAKQ